MLVLGSDYIYSHLFKFNVFNTNIFFFDMFSRANAIHFVV